MYCWKINVGILSFIACMFFFSSFIIEMFGWVHLRNRTQQFDAAKVAPEFATMEKTVSLGHYLIVLHRRGWDLI